MAYTPVETIALIIIVISAIKIFILLVKPMAWLNFDKMIFSNHRWSKIIFIVLAAIVFYYLIQEMTIVQILAVMAFVSLLIGAELIPLMGGILKKFEGEIKGHTLWKDYWFYTLIWVALMTWGVKELFF